MKFLTDSIDACVLPTQSIGGKAFHLGQLNRIGMPVPRWCVISASALQNRIHSRSNTNPTHAQTANPEKRLHLSSDDLAELRFWLEQRQREGHHRFIVRSSMIDEDGAKMSFAGQLESFPNLLTVDGIQAAILKCVESAEASRVTAYREHYSELHSEAAVDGASELPSKSVSDLTAPSQTGARTNSVAVILQVMVDADAAGVLFTADPKDGSRRRFLVSANFGACESVVSGQFDCDEFEIDLASQVVKRRIAKKTAALRFSSHSNEGLTKYAIPPHLQSRQCLEEKDLAQLIALGKKLTKWAKQPLDIEWVMHGNTIWIVQMRPITSLGFDHSQGSSFVFDNSNIQESFDGLTLPLTFSYASDAYFHVYRQLMKVMGFSQTDVAEHDRRHSQMLALIKGRVYYNINSWYAGLLLLPSFGRNKEDMEKMMGVEKPVDFVANQRLTNREKIKRVPQIFKLIGRLGTSFLLMDYLVNDFRSAFSKSYLSFPRTELSWLKIEDLFGLQNRLSKEIMSNWRAPIINDFYVMMTSGRTRRMLASMGAAEILPDLLAGEELESLLPTKALVRIAESIRRNPALSKSLQAGDNEFNRELHQHAEIEKMIDDYVERYGDRVTGELKLETETLRENRAFLTRVLRPYVQDSQLSLAQLNARQLKVRSAAELRVQELLRAKFNPIQRIFKTAQFRSNLRKFRKSVVHREAMRLDRTRSFGIARSIYLELGQRLVDQGLLQNKRDIFYLTMSEVDDFFHGKSLFDEPAALIQLRQKQYSDWAELHPPGQLIISSPLPKILPKHSITTIAQAEGLSFGGLGCYPGIIEGEVCVVSDPNLSIDLRGKILVAMRTDPGWTPLFLQCKGLIVERGSQLSHSAVVARELGLPTVVGIEGICQNLKSGMRVRIDGKLGTISITQLNPPPNSIGEQNVDARNFAN